MKILCNVGCKIVIPIVIFYVFLSITSYFYLDKFIRLSLRQAEMEVDSLSALITRASVDSLKKGNMIQFAYLMKEISRSENIMEFSLINYDGKTLYSSHAEEINKDKSKLIDESKQSEYILSKTDSIGKIMPIKTTNYCIGCHDKWKEETVNSYFYIAINNTSLKTITSIGNQVKVFFPIAFLFFLFYIAFFANFFVTRKLQVIKKGLEELQGGNYEYKFNIKGADEMAQISKSLNKLMETLTSMHKSSDKKD